MQYAKAWGVVQEQHHRHHHNPQLQQPRQKQLPLASCYVPPTKFMSPVASSYMGHPQPQNQQHQQPKRNTPLQLQHYHHHNQQPPPLHQPPSVPDNNYKNHNNNINNHTGNDDQEAENLGFNYVYSNSGKTFQYGLMPTAPIATHQSQFTGNINITMNRSTHLNDLEIIKRDYYFSMVTTMRGGYCGALQRTPPPIPAALNRRLLNRAGNGNIGKVTENYPRYTSIPYSVCSVCSPWTDGWHKSSSYACDKQKNAEKYSIKVMLRMTDNNNAGGCPNENEFISIDQKKRQITFIEASSSSTGVGVGAAGIENANIAAAASEAGPSNAAILDRAPMVSAPKIFAFDGLFTNADPQNDVCTAALQDVIPAVLDGIDGCVLALGHPKSGQSRSIFGSMASAGDLGIIPCAISWLYKGIAEHREKGSRFSVRMSALAVSATKPGAKAHDLLATMASESDDSPGMYFNVGGPVELRAPNMERAALYLDMALSQISNHAYAPATVFTLHVYQYNLEQGKLSGGRSRLHLISLGDAANAKGGLPLSGVGNVLLAVLSGQKHVPYKSHPLTVILRECLASFSSNISVITHLSYAQNRTDALTIIQLSSRIHRIRRKKNKYHPARGGALQLNPNPGSSNVASSSSGLEPSSSEMSADTVIYLGPCHNNNDETDGEHPPVILPNLSYKGNQCTVDVPDNYSKAQQQQQPPPPLTPRKNLISSSQKVSSSSSSATAAFQPAPLPAAVAMHSRQRTESGHKSTHSSPHHHHQQQHHQSHHRQAPRGMIHADNIVMEQWVDGPKVARSKISEARHLKREVNRNKNSETWIDGPRVEAPPAVVDQQPKLQTPARSQEPNHQQQLPAASLLMPNLSSKQRGYGFMDTHKKSMIRKWVENQTTEVLKISGTGTPGSAVAEYDAAGPSQRRMSCSRVTKTPSPDEDDQDSGPSDVPPALPLIDKSSSKTSEKDYGYTMNDYAAQTVESGNDPLAGHPLSALSYGNMSTVSSFHHFEEVRIQSEQQRNTNDKNMDQLARIRELFTSQLALAEVNRVFHFCTNDNNSIYSEPVHKLLDGGDLDSACSEPILFNNNGNSISYNNQVQQPQPVRIVPNQPQRPTELGNKLETVVPSASNTISAVASMTLLSGSIHLQEASSGAADGPGGAATSNLQDLDLEYPFLDQQHGQSSSSNRGYLLNAEIQEELARIIPHVVTEPYDSGHDSTPRTSKHSGFSRRAESGYHSISVTVHDESEVSSLKSTTASTRQAAKRDRRLLCLWLRNPFNCTQAETEAEISDF